MPQDTVFRRPLPSLRQNHHPSSHFSFWRVFSALKQSLELLPSALQHISYLRGFWKKKDTSEYTLQLKHTLKGFAELEAQPHP